MNELVCVADAVHAPLPGPGAPACLARGLSSVTKAWACAEQARSAKGLALLGAPLHQQLTGQSGWMVPNCWPLPWADSGSCSALSPEVPSGREPQLLISIPCLGLLHLGFISPFLLRSPPNDPLAHKSLSRSHS